MSGVPLRIGAFLVGYLAATVAASAAYTLILMISVQIVGVEQPSEFTFAEHVRMVVGFTMFVWLFVVTCALLPAAVAVVVLSLVRLRDVVSHMIAGVLVAGAAILIARNIPFMERLDIDWAIGLSGAAGGAAFWFIWRKLVPARRATA